MGKSAAGPRIMEVSGFAAACKCFAATMASLRGWNDARSFQGAELRWQETSLLPNTAGSRGRSV